MHSQLFLLFFFLLHSLLYLYNYFTHLGRVRIYVMYDNKEYNTNTGNQYINSIVHCALLSS